MTLRILRVELDAANPSVANVVFTDNVIGGGGYDMQIAARPDFSFCVCPSWYIAGNPGNYYMTGLNQDATYYARVRNRGADGYIYDWSPTFAFRTGHSVDRDTAPAAVMIEPALFVLPEPIMAVAPNIDEVPGFPSSNLLRDSPVACRLKVDPAQPAAWFIHTSGAPIDTLALLQTNMPADAIFRVYALADYADYQTNGLNNRQVYEGPARISPGLPGRPGYHMLARLPAPIAGKKLWLILFIAGVKDVTGGILEATYLVVGRNRASKNHSVEKTETPTPLTSSERKRSGMVDRTKGLPMRKVDFELQLLSEMQYETIYGDLWRHEGEPVLVIPNTKAGAFLHDRILFGELSGGRIVNPTSPRYNRSFTINSVI